MQEGEHLSFKGSDVDSIKSGVEKRVKGMLEKTAATANGVAQSEPFANQF